MLPLNPLHFQATCLGLRYLVWRINSGFRVDSAIDTVIGEILLKDSSHFVNDTMHNSTAKVQLETFANWNLQGSVSARTAAIKALDRLEVLASGPVELECIDVLEKPNSYKIRSIEFCMHVVSICKSVEI